MLFSDNIKEMDLLNHLFVEVEYIVRLDVGRSVLLQEGEFVSSGQQSVQNGLLFRIERSCQRRRVSHDELQSTAQWKGVYLTGLVRSPRGRT